LYLTYKNVYDKLNKLFIGVAPKWMQELAERARKNLWNTQLIDLERIILFIRFQLLTSRDLYLSYVFPVSFVSFVS